MQCAWNADHGWSTLVHRLNCQVNSSKWHIYRAIPLVDNASTCLLRVDDGHDMKRTYLSGTHVSCTQSIGLLTLRLRHWATRFVICVIVCLRSMGFRLQTLWTARQCVHVEARENAFCKLLFTCVCEALAIALLSTKLIMYVSPSWSVKKCILSALHDIQHARLARYKLAEKPDCYKVVQLRTYIHVQYIGLAGIHRYVYRLYVVAL